MKDLHLTDSRSGHTGSDRHEFTRFVERRERPVSLEKLHVATVVGRVNRATAGSPAERVDALH